MRRYEGDACAPRRLRRRRRHCTVTHCKKPLDAPFELARRLIIDIAFGLAELHLDGRGVHGDVKLGERVK